MTSRHEKIFHSSLALKIETFKTENNTAPPTLNSSTEFININASNYIRIKL